MFFKASKARVQIRGAVCPAVIPTVGAAFIRTGVSFDPPWTMGFPGSAQINAPSTRAL